MVRGFSAWKELVKFIWGLFSIGPLFKTLLVPFHQESFGPKGSVGEKIIFNLIMRGVGAVARIFIILFGFIFLILSLLTLPFFVLLNLPINPERLKSRRAFGRDLSIRWTPLLRRYAREISYKGGVSLIGKEESYNFLEQILARETQKNALIVGDPGVGRNTLVRELARRISRGQTLPGLQYKHIFELSLEGLNEGDVEKLFTEAAKAGNIIIVLDNLHLYEPYFKFIVPYSDISSLSLIGITDTDNYHKIIRAHGDLLQHFEKVEIKEPNEAETAALVAATLVARKVEFEEDVPKEIVRLTNHLVTTTPQPEKSMDIVDELLARKSKMITKADVEVLMSSKTGVPVGAISQNERKVLENLEEILSERVVGQKDVIHGISEAMRRGRSGVGSQQRPIGSFLFLGPTGVGKTHTAKELAKAYYNSEKSMITFDMTEFSQEFSLDDFTKRLVIKIEENPFTLILFDEIEKSHRSIQNLFLQILDEGRIADLSGREAIFYNTFIICTSNALSNVLVQNPNIEKEEFIKEVIESGTFTPEFLNRFDGVFLYRPLNKEDGKKIAELLLEDFVKKMKDEKDLTVTYDPDLADALAEKALDTNFGAREIRREIEQTVQNYIADQIISGSQVKNVSISKDLVLK